MANVLAELIRRMIRQNTVNVGEPVSNIHGATAAIIQGLESFADIEWMRLTVPGNQLIGIEDFYRQYLIDSSKPFDILTAPGGVLKFTESRVVVQLYRGVVTLENPALFTINAQLGAPTARAALYVNGVLDRSSSEKLNSTRFIDAGSTVVELMVVSTDLTLTTPAEIKISAIDEVVPLPVWAGISTGYADTAGASTIVTLSWNADTRSGGWKLFRRQLTQLGIVTDLGSASDTATVGVTLSGNYEALILPGNDFLAGNNVVGTILRAEYQTSTDTTSATVQLQSNLADSNPAWIGRPAAVGARVEIARIKRSNSSGLITYTDTSVSFGQGYTYTLQGYGLFDETQVGLMSESRYIVAGDVLAPASIVIQNKGLSYGYPQVFDKIARVKFTTPADADYAGVKVIYRQSLTGTISSVAGTTINVTVTGLVSGAAVGWILRPTNGPAQNAERTVQSNTATALVVDQAYEAANLPVAGNTILLYKDKSVVIDYGLPNRDDELLFTTVGFGLYHFRTFDLGGNEQPEVACETWTYTATDDRNNDVSGTQILSNPSFFAGLNRYEVYDNLSSGKVTKALITDATAPNPSGKIMRISVATGATPDIVTNPGEGGFYVSIGEDGGTYRPDTYHKAAAILWVVRAKIPVGYKIEWQQNLSGTENQLAPQTSLLGTGAYVEYRWLQTVGTTGTFSTIGFWNLRPVGAYDNVAFSWDVAQVAGYDKNAPSYGVVLPTLLLTPSETGSNGSVIASVVDPQNRVSGSGAGVRFTTISGRSAAVVGSLIAPGSVWSSVTSPGDVILQEKVPSYIECDLFGIDANGNQGVLLDHKRQTFSMGNVPYMPEIGYSVNELGELTVIGTVDNDTNYVKAIASKVAPPSQASVAAASPVTVVSSVANFGKLLTGGTALNTGERYWVAMIAYNAADSPSDMAALTDVYVVGSSTSLPIVTWISTTATASNLKFTVKPNRHCAEFEIYAKEFTGSDPGDLDVSTAYPIAFDDIVVGPDSLRYRAQPETNYDVIVPTAAGTNWIAITIIPYDSLARQGLKLNKRAQGTGTAAPLVPSSATADASPTSTTITNKVTTSASPVADRIRAYRDGALIQTYAHGAGASTLVTMPADTGLNPGTAYTYTYSGYDSATGAESPTRTSPITVSTTATPTIPQPTLAIGSISYNAGSESWSVVVTPGSGSPAGVVWHLYRHTAATPLGSFTERTGAASTSISLSDSDPMDTSTGTNYWFAVKGTLTGWTNSLFSNPTTPGTEVATGSVHKTGYDEPTSVPVAVSLTNPLTHQVQLTWSNTDSLSNIYVAVERLVSGVWEPAQEVGGIAPGTTTRVVPVIVVGVFYRGRVRYYNGHRNGTFSSYVQTVSPIT